MCATQSNVGTEQRHLPNCRFSQHHVVGSKWGTVLLTQSTFNRPEGFSMQSDFVVWDASDPADYQAWLEFWDLSPHREVASHPDYANLFKGEADRALCAAYHGKSGSVLYSFILRDIPDSVFERTSLTDITTPYGYGGPLAWNSPSIEDLAAQFWPLFDAWARTRGVVTEFIRFGLFPDMYLPYPGETVCRSKNIVRTLQLDEESMFMTFESKVRKNVKKARRNGLSVLIDETGSHLTEFLNIYHSTMDRRGANEGYYFSRPFFEALQNKLPGSFIYAHILFEDKIISSELVLVSKDSAYSFLGGTDKDAFDLRPNDYLKYEIIRWAKSQGKQHFVLGGGASPGDGIERYKRSFAPDGSVDFITGQRILLPDVYNELSRRSQTDATEGELPTAPAFFPEYRRTI
ncbi:GNAT family N-acetyltransferase [Arthrobacter sp. NPDC057009]|uniref:GNAT family N-acetyltransferase n=1 Tax=Arthrobacter sp. NPDC057009 TaxID=3345996 RepID=UPI00362ED261